MTKRKWVYNSFLILGLMFIVLGARLYFRDDIGGLLLHFALGIALFVAALFTGRDRKDGEAKDDRRA